MASAFSLPNAISNAVMVASTFLAISLVLVALLLKSERGRFFGVGALPPLLILSVYLPDAVNRLPGVFWRSLVISGSDPFPDSGYSNFYRVAIAMHLVAGIIGSLMLLVAARLSSGEGEP
jgi:hypothetical protein